VNLSELGSLDLFAKWLLRLVVTIAVAVVCSAAIAIEIGNSKPRATTRGHVVAFTRATAQARNHPGRLGSRLTFLALRLSGVNKVVGSLALSEVGIPDPAVNLFVDQMSQGIRSIGNLHTLKQFAASPNNTLFFNEVSQHEDPSDVIKGT
jgi:hypothetical protein